MPKAKELVDTPWSKNYIAAIKILMAETGIDTQKDMAEYMRLPYITFYKIMNREQNPTIEHCVQLCLKSGLNANWLLMNKGERKIKDATTLAEIKKFMKSIDEKL